MNIFKLSNIYTLSFLFFMIYFSIQPFVQYEAFLGKIPDLLNICLVGTFVLFLIILINYTLNMKKNRYNSFDTFAVLLFINMLLYIFFDKFFYSHNQELYHRNLIVLLYAVMFYIVGKHFYYIERYKTYIVVVYIILVMEKLINIDSNAFHIITKLEGSAGTSLYLYIGDTLAIMGILVLTIVKNKQLKIVIIFLSMLTLFIVYSRTSLYVFTLIAIIYIFKKFGTKSKLIFYILLLFSLMFILNIVSLAELEEMRMLSFLFTGEDRSVSGRVNGLLQGLQAIKDNILIGDYGGQLFATGSMGTYIHNILSYYRQFGIIALVTLVSLFYLSFQRYNKWNQGNYSTGVDYVFYISLFIFIEVFIGRSYVSPLLWFAFGMLSNKRLLKISKKGKRN